jgi:hypothetical protein
MTLIEQKACYGTMFPSVGPLNAEKLHPGKVFTLKAVTPTRMMPQRRSVWTDLWQWDDCRACPDFDHCYRLCMAKMMFQDAADS